VMNAAADSTIPQAAIRPASYDEEETELFAIANSPLRNGSLNRRYSVGQKFPGKEF
jgi:hypothetical protein